MTQIIDFKSYWASVTFMVNLYLLKGQLNFINRISPAESKLFEKFCQTDFMKYFECLITCKKNSKKITHVIAWDLVHRFI